MMEACGLFRRNLQSYLDDECHVSLGIAKRNTILAATSGAFGSFWRMVLCSAVDKTLPTSYGSNQYNSPLTWSIQLLAAGANCNAIENGYHHMPAITPSPYTQRSELCQTSNLQEGALLSLLSTNVHDHRCCDQIWMAVCLHCRF